MSPSFLASVRAMFGPHTAFDRPQRSGTQPLPDAHAPGAALGARAIDV
ncbi:phosphonate ABC transporter ATP-binding protein, partial [Burkholderia sp. Ac-20392]|nr:phosphonate ABC transporter ATP-binding protein [Burkholderia sp. Ac-20392]